MFTVKAFNSNYDKHSEDEILLVECVQARSIGGNQLVVKCVDGTTQVLFLETYERIVVENATGKTVLNLHEPNPYEPLCRDDGNTEDPLST